MIQDILGGSYLLGDEKKILSTILEGTPTSFPAAPAATATATVPTSGAANASTTSSSSENLRCPRCHSANTKFCYYNNYNLTQPRHFCKSCRRYWTKGGALRNVPIGGGCRKSKVGSALPNSAARSSSKFRNMASEIGRFSFEQDLLQPAPALWAPTQNSPLLSLLKTAAKQNHNPNVLLPSLVKAEPFFGIGHTVSEQSRSTNVRPVGFSDPLGPSHMALDLSRNDRQNGLLVPNAPGIQELYQRLRLSGDSGSEPFNEAAVVTGGGSCSNSSPLAGQGPASSAAGGEFRFWNYNVPAFASSDLSNN